MTGEGFLLSQPNVSLNAPGGTVNLQQLISCISGVTTMHVLNALGGLNLDNTIQQNEWNMPSGEEVEEMKRRQKLTIGGVTQWRTFDTTQELVNMVEALTSGGVTSAKANRSFQDYALEWYERYKKPVLGEGHNANYQSMMKVHIFPAIGKKDVADITVGDVQGIMDTLQTASTGKQVKSIINMIMDSAIADELYHHPNPTKDKRIHMPTAKTERSPVSKEDLALIMKHLPNMASEHSKLLALLIMTGARRGEVLGARWEDIDWTTKTIHFQRVVRFKNNRPMVSTTMKTPAANRIVSIWDDLIPCLGEPQESGFIVSRDGEPLSERQFRNSWNALMKQLKAIGVEPFTPHQLRHSYATIAANSGNIPPKVLQGMLGRANFTTTMNIYAGLDNEKIRQSSSGLSAEYAQISGKVAAELH